jgi:hypothetical protein
LLSEKLTESSGKNYLQKKICPHCGKMIDWLVLSLNFRSQSSFMVTN